MENGERKKERIRDKQEKENIPYSISTGLLF
jgi:hypothetical protein